MEGSVVRIFPGQVENRTGRWEVLAKLEFRCLLTRLAT